MQIPRNASLLAALATAVLLVGAGPVAAESWTYRADLGGWLDNETGLVWGQSSRVWNPSAWYSYSGAVYGGIPTYQQMTNNAKWRLPTVAEAQTAHAHNIYSYISQTGDTSVAFAWASDKQGKKQAWIVWISTGKAMLTSVNSSAAVRPVYRP